MTRRSSAVIPSARSRVSVSVVIGNPLAVSASIEALAPRRRLISQRTNCHWASGRRPKVEISFLSLMDKAFFVSHESHSEFFLQCVIGRSSNGLIRRKQSHGRGQGAQARATVEPMER